MKPPSDTRKPYGGSTRALVIALDVGTTFSGVSYAILEPGEVPKIHGVTRFPGQEHVAGNSKIPSVMYYDKRGTMQAAGAEAENASVLSQAEDEGWIKAELFKLRLRPKTMKLQMNGMQLGPLPRNKTSVDVFGHFLAYLFQCTQNFITDTHANGPALWNAVQHDIQFVLSHPNGWEGAQQTKMRRAAVYGGLIPDTDEGKARIRFVTEGEASLHACVLNGLAADVLSNPSRHGFLVADAGGGTLDISSYAIRGTTPLVIEEIAPPDCVFSGSVFVSRRARAFLQEKLRNSKYGTPDALDHITKRFDETTKRLFRDQNDLQFIPFGSPLDKDLSVGIRGGQLKLTGTEVAEFFEPSIEAAVASIRAQIEASQGVVRSVWLVGGFAASPWLFSQLQERLAPLRVTVSRPDSQTSKAVADGAIGFYSDHHVSARMSKYMYGVEFLREYDAQDQEHVTRKNRLCELPSGPKLLPDAFDCILARSVKVKESTVFSRKYCTELTSLSTLSVFEVEIWCYRGGNTVPPWILREAEEFSTLCVVRADLSPLSGSAQPKQGKNGKTYWTIVFSVEIHFGLTEFRARIKWVDNGKTRYGPASIVYNESGSRAVEDEADSAPEDDFSSAPPQSRIPSRGQSPASFTSRSAHVNGMSPAAIEFPRTDSLISTPNLEATRGFEREKTTSRGLPSSSSTPLTDADRGRSRRGSGREFEPITAKDKGKEREQIASGFADRSLPSHSRTTSTTSKLGEALTDVWGAAKSASPSSSPLIEPSKPSQSASAKAASPKVDFTKPATPKVATPKEKTRESSRLGDRLADPEIPAEAPAATTPSQIDTALLAAVTEPSPLTAPGTWGNNTSWNDNTAANGTITKIEEQADKAVEEPLPDPKKTKKKGGKTPSKLASKAASVAPTPGAITPPKPKERSPSNDWAKLAATTTDPVTIAFGAIPEVADAPKAIGDDTNKQNGDSGTANMPVFNTDATGGKLGENTLDTFVADDTKEQSGSWRAEIPATTSNTFWEAPAESTHHTLPPVDTSTANFYPFLSGTTGDSKVEPISSWGGFDGDGGGWDLNGSANQAAHDTGMESTHDSSGPGFDSWGMGYPSVPEGSGVDSPSSHGVTNLSDALGLGKSSPKLKTPHTSKRSSPKPTPVHHALEFEAKAAADIELAKSLPAALKTPYTSKLPSPAPTPAPAPALDPLAIETDGHNAASNIDQPPAKSLLKTPRTSKPASPKPTSDPLPSQADANTTAANIEQTPAESSPAAPKTPHTPKPSSPIPTPDPLPSEAETTPVALNSEQAEVKDTKTPPLNKAQQKKKKQQEAKEAKEKADREFQEQLERELAEEANANNGDSWNNDKEGGDAEGAGSNMAGGENVILDATKDPKNEGEDNPDGEVKKDEEKKEEEEKEDFGFPVKAKKGKKKKGGK